MADNFKLDESTQKSLLIFYGIFSIFILITLIYNYFYADKHTKEDILNENYVRIVNSVYINKEEHNFLYVKYSDNTIESPNFHYNKNDSLVKRRGDSIEYIFRNQNVIENNLLLRFREYEKGR